MRERTVGELAQELNIDAGALLILLAIVGKRDLGVADMLDAGAVNDFFGVLRNDRVSIRAEVVKTGHAGVSDIVSLLDRFDAPGGVAHRIGNSPHTAGPETILERKTHGRHDEILMRSGSDHCHATDTASGLFTGRYDIAGEDGRTGGYDTFMHTANTGLGSACTGRYDGEERRAGGGRHPVLSERQEIKLKKSIYWVEGVISAPETSGEAAVYLINDRNMKRFALKMYPTLHHGPNPQVLERIINIKHDNILRLVDYGVKAGDRYQGSCWEIADYAQGRNLLQVDDFDKKYTPEFIENIIVPQLFSALKELHHNGIVHCDLKPHNIFYTDAGQTKLVVGDYGGAKKIGNNSWEKAHVSDNIVCTKDYVAAELLLGLIKSVIDYFSFGMVLLHLLYPEAFSTDEITKKRVMRRTHNKPIWDFDPTRERLNDLIAGLTLYNIDNRWGQPQVEAWLRGEQVPVKYDGGDAVINIDNKRKLRTIDDLVAYVEDTANWLPHQRGRDLRQLPTLFGHPETFNGLCGWVARIHPDGIRALESLEQIVHLYADWGKAFVREAVLRYLKPGAPIRIDATTFDFSAEVKFVDTCAGYIDYLDNRWKSTRGDEGMFRFGSAHEHMQFFLFQLEYTLYLHKIRGGSEKERDAAETVLKEISSVAGVSVNGNFGQDFDCPAFHRITPEGLLKLFWNYCRGAGHALIEGKDGPGRGFKGYPHGETGRITCHTLGDVGLYFARYPDEYSEHFMCLEREEFCRRLKRNDCVGLDRDPFLFAALAREAVPEITFDRLTVNPDGFCLLRYRRKLSLTPFLNAHESKLSIDETAAEAGGVAVHEYAFSRPLLQSNRAVFKKFLGVLDQTIDTGRIPAKNRAAFYREFNRTLGRWRRSRGFRELVLAAVAGIPAGLLAAVAFFALLPSRGSSHFMHTLVLPTLTVLRHHVGRYLVNPEAAGTVPGLLIFSALIAVSHLLVLWGTSIGRDTFEPRYALPAGVAKKVFHLHIGLLLLPLLFMLVSYLWEVAGVAVAAYAVVRFKKTAIALPGVNTVARKLLAAGVGLFIAVRVVNVAFVAYTSGVLQGHFIGGAHYLIVRGWSDMLLYFGFATFLVLYGCAPLIHDSHNPRRIFIKAGGIAMATFFCLALGPAAGTFAGIVAQALSRYSGVASTSVDACCGIVGAARGFPVYANCRIPRL